MGKRKVEPGKAEAFKEKGAAILEEKNNNPEPKKRHRRTRAELEAERTNLTDNGYELFADFMKMLSDNDSAKYKLDKQPREFFEPLARQYSSIMNYFMPSSKPIYFAIGTALLGSFMMLRTRAELIAEKMPKKEINGDKSKREEGNLSAGQERSGQIFPSETPLEEV